MKDLITISDSIVSNMSTTNDSVSIWLWVTIFMFILLVWLLIKRNKQKKNKLDLAGVKKSELKSSENIDMSNLLNSIHHSKELYKELSKRCHPDIFANKPEYKIAEELFQKISRNRRNFEQLMLIKEEAK